MSKYRRRVIKEKKGGYSEINRPAMLKMQHTSYSMN